MNHDNKDMKMYARVGLRSHDEWTSLGRAVNADTAPRATANHQGRTVDLFTRDQTHARPPRDRTAAAAPAAATDTVH